MNKMSKHTLQQLLKKYSAIEVIGALNKAGETLEQTFKRLKLILNE